MRRIFCDKYNKEPPPRPEIVSVIVYASLLALILLKAPCGSWPVQPMEPSLRGARLGRVVSKFANSPGVPQSQVSFKGLIR